MTIDALVFGKNELSKIASDIGQPYAPNTTLTFIDGTTKPVSPDIENGKLYFGLKDDASSTTITINGQNVSVGNYRAYIFLDHNNNRYAITGPVDWDDIFHKPTIANNITYTASTKKLALFNIAGGEITNVTLPFVKTAGDNITGHLYFTGANESSSTSSTSQIVFGTSSNNHLALSSNKEALVINPTTSSTANQIVLYLNQASRFPLGIDASGSTITATTFSGDLTGTADKAKKDSGGNEFVSSYVSYSFTDITKDHEIKFSTPEGANKTWTENDHYPTALTWTAGTTAGPTATITMYKNGVADTANNINITAIPSASTATSGIITTGNQTIHGSKTFETSVVVGLAGATDSITKLKVYGSMNIGNDRVNLSYNERTESLDFSFI